jgi:hypothetical protein
MVKSYAQTSSSSSSSSSAAIAASINNSNNSYRGGNARPSSSVAVSATGGGGGGPSALLSSSNRDTAATALAKKLIMSEIDPLRSGLHTAYGGGLEKLILEMICCGRLQWERDVMAFVSCTLMSVQQPADKVRAACILSCVRTSPRIQRC